jgi:hypothetical protein
MNCPNCGTYNPEDRTVCWRCDKELPKPKPVKKRNPQAGQLWLYVIVGAFFLITIFQSCGLKTPFAPAAPAAPSGYVTPRMLGG